VDADLQPNNFGLNSARKYAQDREHWKHLVETAMLQLGACNARDDDDDDDDDDADDQAYGSLQAYSKSNNTGLL